MSTPSCGSSPFCHLANSSAIVLGITLATMAAATIALGRDEGAYEEVLEAELATRAGPPTT